MRQSENYQLNLPEAEDAADIEKVSEAIEDIDGILADKVGHELSADETISYDENSIFELKQFENYVRLVFGNEDHHHFIKGRVVRVESESVIQIFGSEIGMGGDVSISIGYQSEIESRAKKLEWESVDSDQSIHLKTMILDVLNQFLTISPTATITTTTGTLKAKNCKRCGNVVHLHLSGGNNNSVAAGSDIFVGNLTSPSLLPLHRVTTGSYYGEHACNAIFDPDGTITIRNASPSAFTPVNGVSIAFTYIVQNAGDLT